MKRLFFFSALLCAYALVGQNLSLAQDSYLTVRHLHGGGWASHSLELELTPKALLLTGTQEFPVGEGAMGYCVFPAQIPLERIIKVEAKREGLASGLKLFSATSNSYNIVKLHLEYHDERGGTHSLDFIPGDAQQSNNAWSGGNSEAVRSFAEAAKYAADLRTQQIKAASAPPVPEQVAPVLVDPDTGKKVEMPDSANDAENAVTADGNLQTSAVPVLYKAQMPWADTIHRVNVWPISPVDHSRLRVQDADTGNLLIDIPLERINRVKVRQHVVELTIPTPGVITIPLGPGYGPKVYELCLRMYTVGTKEVTNCVISDQAQCARGAQCQEGLDGGRNILSLEEGVNKAIASRAKELKQIRN
jgi:hypothetical protein